MPPISQGDATNVIYPGARVMMALDYEIVEWFGAMVCTFNQSEQIWLMAFDDGEFREMTHTEISEGVRRHVIKPMNKVNILLAASNLAPALC